ncbi:uncharacterized protein LOC124926254 [Impatiens glandulifera]|uniref:uncharacterized protein LOC124926254 n=1 Tax=Impatiens glandulifera TaxID=253017 RepID=UPI001FB19877|nr:uncharacterized protein LOC124926254 [Impatiens glandulifera]
MNKKREVKWSWLSAFVGAASATAATAIILGKPKDPDFELVSIDFKSFNLNLPHLDADVILTVHVNNPNIVPIRHSSAEMSISYAGSFLGAAMIDAGSQPPRSCRLLKLPAKLSGLELAHQAARFIGDVRKREMVLEAGVDLEGYARVLWWDHKFKVRVDSLITVDPLFLDVIEQENKSKMQIFLA